MEIFGVKTLLRILEEKFIFSNVLDMDAKAQDIDIQSAEAYVNSEYAVALTELEV